MAWYTVKSVFFLLWLTVSFVGSAHFYWEYIVVGAGPGGLQLGYFLQQAGRNYVILERSNISGSFYTTFPRHDRLISINKRHTGRTNKEFNMRHDWNSLLSHDESLQMRHYSREFFPHREVMLRYLNDYQRRLNLHVRYDTEVRQVRRVANNSEESLPGAPSSPDGQMFTMLDQLGNTYTCRTLVLATGMGKTNTPDFEGVELTESYESISTNPEDYEGQSVLILGLGNSAFEVADSIYGSTNLIHIMSRSRVRLSWSTHYVGDLRAINNGLLDTYQLKSLDGVLEASVEELKIVKDGNKLRTMVGGRPEVKFDNFALRDPYDRIIRCLGWRFDDSILADDTNVTRSKGRKEKYPDLMPNYESSSVPGLFFAGTNSHGLDHRKSSGGFIHGFRYTAQTLFYLLEWRNHNTKWPSTIGPIDQLVNFIVKRVNEASATYQMFSVLGDVIVLRDGGKTFEYLEQFPLRLLPRFTHFTGHQVAELIVVSMEYGANFSGPGKDIFRIGRAVGEPIDAHMSNFLHPVLYFYKTLPSEEDFRELRPWELMPRPHRLHHIVEDFLTLWDAPISHILPLRRFIETIIDKDLRVFFAEDCLKMALTFRRLPNYCRDQFTAGSGLLGTEPLLAAANQAKLLL